MKPYIQLKESKNPDKWKKNPSLRVNLKNKNKKPQPRMLKVLYRGEDKTKPMGGAIWDF